MTYSALANGQQITSDSDARTTGIDRFIVHHAATTSLAAILSLFQPGGREVSANYALGSDGTLVLAVDESRRAWTSASAEWDGRAVTIEVADAVAGGSWPVSDAAFDKLARLISDVSGRYGFPINDDTVLTHQELYTRYGVSYATSCPGDLQRRKGELLALANRYRAGVAPTPPKRTDTRVMLSYHYQDRAGRKLAPGTVTRLKNAKSADQNVVGNVGRDYSITPHLVAEGGQPGDSLELVLVWQNGAKPPSMHYPVRGVADASGKVALSPEFKRAVASRDAVFVQVSAPATNKGTFTVTVLDSDAYLFSR